MMCLSRWEHSNSKVETRGDCGKIVSNDDLAEQICSSYFGKREKVDVGSLYLPLVRMWTFLRFYINVTTVWSVMWPHPTSVFNVNTTQRSSNQHKVGSRSAAIVSEKVQIKTSAFPLLHSPPHRPCQKLYLDKEKTHKAFAVCCQGAFDAAAIRSHKSNSDGYWRQIEEEEERIRPQ